MAQGVINEWGAVKILSAQWISTGVMRVDFQRPRGVIAIADYSVFCQPSVHGQSCIVTGKYSTYFIVSVRNASGVADNIDFAFQMVGDNH